MVSNPGHRYVVKTGRDGGADRWRWLRENGAARDSEGMPKFTTSMKWYSSMRFAPLKWACSTRHHQRPPVPPRRPIASRVVAARLRCIISQRRWFAGWRRSRPSRLMKSGATCRASVKICLHRRMVRRGLFCPRKRMKNLMTHSGTMSAISRTVSTKSWKNQKATVASNRPRSKSDAEIC